MHRRPELGTLNVIGPSLEKLMELIDPTTEGQSKVVEEIRGVEVGRGVGCGVGLGVQAQHACVKRWLGPTPTLARVRSVEECSFCHPGAKPCHARKTAANVMTKLATLDATRREMNRKILVVIAVEC